MPLRTFGVTAPSVRRHMFPQLPGEFSAVSRPSAAMVEEAITDAAGDLAGRLRMEGVSADALDTGTLPPPHPAAYAWCAKTIRLMVAIAVLPAMTAQDPELGKAWRAELKERLKHLDEFGHVALGDAPAPAQNANGPLSHLTTYGLDTGDARDASSAAPRFRRDDQL